MLTRYFTVIGILIIIALIIRNLLNRKQRHALHRWVSLFAKLLLAVSLLSALWATFVGNHAP